MYAFPFQLFSHVTELNNANFLPAGTVRFFICSANIFTGLTTQTGKQIKCINILQKNVYKIFEN